MTSKYLKFSSCGTALIPGTLTANDQHEVYRPPEHKVPTVQPSAVQSLSLSSSVVQPW